jgi:hypothetical protein
VKAKIANNADRQAELARVKTGHELGLDGPSPCGYKEKKIISKTCCFEISAVFKMVTRS